MKTSILRRAMLAGAIATSGLVGITAATPAHAQLGGIVYDPTNYAQNVLTAARSLQQINNQIRQLQNEAQMLMNQARNLASLPSSVVNQLRANLATTERLIAQARGLAYDVTNLDREFARLYPEQYAATVSGEVIGAVQVLIGSVAWSAKLPSLLPTLRSVTSKPAPPPGEL